MHDFRSLQRRALLDHLRRHIAGEVRFDPTSRRLYSTDASIYQVEPAGVVIPRSVDDLVSAVQIAADLKVPITARGGGTSLSGQSIGTGLVLDCSKYLNHIGPVDATTRRVRVQPGVVLEQLNRAVSAHGLQFGPDVATSKQATLGGMLGNNSAGSHSVVYGKTADHTRSLRMILADGSQVEFEPLSPREWEHKADRDTREGHLYRTLREVVLANRDEIRSRFPHIIRRVSGYNLAAYVDPEAPPEWLAWLDAPNSDEAPSSARPSLVPLLVGSEGTLGVLTEAELELVPKPKATGLLVPHFETLRSALDALAACLEMSPSAVELMDRMLIELARTQRSLSRTMSVIQGRPEALLMVEFTGESVREVTAKVERLRDRLAEVPGLIGATAAIEAELRDPLWRMRSSAVPLLFGMPGDRKPVTFCEDTAVSPEKLPEFADRIREVFHKHGTDGSFYGHASVGCLHIRPVLNLKNPDDVAGMRRIMSDVVDLVLEYGGSLSGEHGDGMVRSEWNRKIYGPVIDDAFRVIKHAFDPDGVLNPGKIVNGPPMTESLRFVPQSRVSEPPTIFDYSKQEGFFRSIELCNGSGVCRKTQGGAMCPSYRATMDERDTTRGRANALRLALTTVATGEAKKGEAGLKGRWLKPVMDLCLSCKACKAECPSNVDVAKLKAEFQQAYYANRVRPIGHHVAANIHTLNRIGSTFAGSLNWFNRRGLTRWLMEKLAGIDRRRSLPEVHARHFRRWFRNRKPNVPDDAPRVLLMADCFTTYNEPQIPKAAVRVLEASGFRVELADMTCCGRAMLSKGFLKRAQRMARDQIPTLARQLRPGEPILGLEPSCILTLADEWPELVPGEEARRVAEAAHLAEHWLAGKSTLTSDHPQTEKVVFHGHCHQRSLCGVEGSAQAMRSIPGVEVDILDAGCCGMAGSFGYEKEHFDISVRIAELALIPALAARPEMTIAATGTSCRHQIKDLTGRKAWHPIEVMARALS